MKPPITEPDVWRYILPDGWEILAGKTDADNDRLSLRAARPNDYWFHVRGLPGSHVILCSATGEAPGNHLIKTAAAVAAWHSNARTAGTVSVSCTQVKNVSKPRGTKPGTVTIKKEKTIRIKPALPSVARDTPA
ncbi:MAG: NFACT RNA binding domain-containing protein [Kiritimatiellales bacterium]